MKVLVIGSTGGSGRAVVARLLAEGHVVTAFSRRGDRLGIDSEQLHTFSGDALDPADVARAVAGHDAVVVTLGISENPLRVRLLGPRHTPLDVRSRGTRNVIAAMRAHGLRRLVVLTSYGVGATKGRLRFIDRLFFSLLLKPQIRDTEVQNQDVIESRLDWVIAQPVHLTDADEDAVPFMSAEGATARMQVSRKSVARFLADAVASPKFVRQTVALSGN
jgi:nucleoside-diphosphate-sugar epimerase